MRYGVISDIHSNLEALEAVLSALAREGVNLLLCCGDIVGYAADPAACVELVRRKVNAGVGGNHDWAAAGKLDMDWFNPQARLAVAWTVTRLSEDQKKFLGSLPLTWRDENVTLVHGSLDQPEEFPYIFDLSEAQASLKLQETLVGFMGHTHLPGFFTAQEASGSYEPAQGIYRLKAGVKVLVNVGSVGQPRDRDPRAAYCLYDSDEKTIEIRRVAYPFERTQEKIRAAGLPGVLADRLAAGY
ncbi:MAG: metallophosphatase family protein [Candidatus Omnitrophica bacterium]|nr:metallophosphatase family protein [Candidatus Omnitrophota bacterium]